jgi:hypothetical protein
MANRDDYIKISIPALGLIVKLFGWMWSESHLSGGAEQEG